jgi:hypothetical protein
MTCGFRCWAEVYNPDSKREMNSSSQFPLTPLKLAVRCCAKDAIHFYSFQFPRNKSHITMNIPE